MCAQSAAHLARLPYPKYSDILIIVHRTTPITANHMTWPAGFASRRRNGLAGDSALLGKKGMHTTPLQGVWGNVII